MKNLIGKTINRIFVSKKDQTYLRFETNKGNVDFGAGGECCSESYFSDVNRIKNIIGEKVIDVKEIELMEEEITNIPSRQEEDKIYGFKITTEKGDGLVIMRNSSNGYYGGWVQESPFPESEEKFEIVKDFCSLDITKNETSN
jgi:hypothetical protein